jgi:hypothetical protein
MLGAKQPKGQNHHGAKSLDPEESITSIFKINYYKCPWPRGHVAAVVAIK